MNMRYRVFTNPKKTNRGYASSIYIVDLDKNQYTYIARVHHLVMSAQSALEKYDEESMLNLI